MRRAFVALTAVAGVMAACQLVAGIDDRSVGPNVTDASGDREPVDAGPVDRCAHAYPPEAGSGPDGPNVDRIVLALDLAILSESDGGREQGFDLDGLCSVDGGTDSCLRCLGSDVDDPQGRDNSAASLLRGPLGKAFPAASDAGPNDRFRLLIEIDDYNGSDQDPDVGFAFYRSHGAVPVDDARSEPPKNDGTDVWSTTADSVYPIVKTPLLFGRGAVVDGRFVARITDEQRDGLPLDFGGQFLPGINAARIRMLIRNAVVVLPLPRGQETVTRGGVLAGRWNAKELLVSLLPLPIVIGSDVVYLCNTTFVDQLIKPNICQYADVLTVAGEERSGKHCDAISIVFGISAAKAKRSDTPLFEVDAGPDHCLQSTPVTDCTPVFAEPPCSKR